MIIPLNLYRFFYMLLRHIALIFRTVFAFTSPPDAIAAVCDPVLALNCTTELEDLLEVFASPKDNDSSHRLRQCLPAVVTVVPVVVFHISLCSI